MNKMLCLFTLIFVINCGTTPPQATLSEKENEEVVIKPKEKISLKEIDIKACIDKGYSKADCEHIFSIIEY